MSKNRSRIYIYSFVSIVTNLQKPPQGPQGDGHPVTTLFSFNINKGSIKTKHRVIMSYKCVFQFSECSNQNYKGRKRVNFVIVTWLYRVPYRCSFYKSMSHWSFGCYLLFLMFIFPKVHNSKHKSPIIPKK